MMKPGELSSLPILHAAKEFRPEPRDSGRFFGKAVHGEAENGEHFPTTLEETEKLEEMLGKQMDSLSLEERDKILFDIHGFSELEEEDDTTIDNLLNQLEEELRKSQSDKDAYFEAKYFNEAYVNDRGFRLMFLRSEEFDPKLAAERLIMHFRIKRDLFGTGEVLGRDIRLSDMSDDDMETLESGFFQIFPTRDVAGRSIFCLASACQRYKEIDNVSRTMWYVMMTSLRNEETQKKGVIVLVYNTGYAPKLAEVLEMKHVYRAGEGIPMKYVGGHYCYSEAFLRPFVAVSRLYMERSIHMRFRFHHGNHNEILFKLQTFGINTDGLPISKPGDISLDWHNEWVQNRKRQEASNESTSDDITVPRRFDVLFGRKKSTKEHTGNLRANHLVLMYQDKYEKANKFEKTEIAERIVSVVHESYGRFLKWEDEIWVEVDHETAREKISHFFRRKRLKK